VSFGQFPDDAKPHDQYTMVRDGRKELDVGAESLSIPTAECNSEEILLHMQDSDDIDSDFSSLNSQPPSLGCPEEVVNQWVTPIDEEEAGVTGQMSDEAVNKDENNLVMTGVPVECEEESSSSRVPAVVMKAGRKQNKQS